MFKKIEINNVGRFQQVKTSSDTECFKKYTFIYGKNTFGKSTLTSIFKSLKENKPDYIIGRKTVGSQKQAVKIIPEITTPTGEYRYTTDENKWSAEFSDITIFDNHFVRENVYTQNQQIGQDQQKSIEAFMLGARGVEYNKKIADFVDKIRENTRVQTVVSSEYSGSRHLFGGLTFDAFLGLTEVKDIEKTIEGTEKELDKIKNAELISSKLESIKLILKRFEEFDTTAVSENISVNSELITKHFENHVNPKESKLIYSTFLQTGSKLRLRDEEECCPFCTQKIEGEKVDEFLKTIDLVYNEKYRDLQQAIKAADTHFGIGSISMEIEKSKKDLQQAGYSLVIDFSDVDALLELCKKSITDKKDDLSQSFDSKPFVQLSAKVAEHVTSMDEEMLKFANPTERKAELEDSLKKLQANKERFGSWKVKCEDYTRAKKDNETLSIQKAALWDEYLVYAGSLSGTMLADINGVLSACGCNFVVKKFSFRGNQRQDLLVLELSGAQIANDGSDSNMTIKNSLSDSDKWVLALAFFLATVKNDSEIKVVVMDDPVSSFDVDRKRIIFGEIKKVILASSKQLILLTHEKGFFHLIHAESKNDPAFAFIRIALDQATGSTFLECNPDDDAEFMSDYNVWISEMKSAQSLYDLGEVKSIHANIRPVIEHILKVKYPLDLQKEHITVEKMLTKLEEVGGPYSTVTPRTSITTLLTNLTHHDNSGVSQFPVQYLGIDDYKKDIRDAFQVIKVL